MRAVKAFGALESEAGTGKEGRAERGRLVGGANFAESDAVDLPLPLPLERVEADEAAEAIAALGMKGILVNSEERGVNPPIESGFLVVRVVSSSMQVLICNVATYSRQRSLIEQD